MSLQYTYCDFIFQFVFLLFLSLHRCYEKVSCFNAAVTFGVDPVNLSIFPFCISLIICHLSHHFMTPFRSSRYLLFGLPLRAARQFNARILSPTFRAQTTSIWPHCLYFQNISRAWSFDVLIPDAVHPGH